MSDRKRGGQLQHNSAENIYRVAVEGLGMNRQDISPYGAGRYYRGDGIISDGVFWYYCSKESFGVAVSDFHALQDCPMYMPAARYMCLRWSKAGYLSDGHLTSYVEEKGGEARAILKAGTRVAYVEIQFMAEYYEKRLPEMLTVPTDCRLPDVLKKLSASGIWPEGTFQIFRDIDKYNGSGPAAELFFQSAAIKLISLLLQSEQQSKEIAKSDFQGITAVTDYICANLDKDLTQRELAYIAQMSASKLKGVFKAFTKKTMTEYIAEKRIEKAEELLAHTAMPIEEIAVLVGFRTPAGFSTAFHKWTGRTPRELRKLTAFWCNPNPSVIFSSTDALKVLSNR